LVVCIYLFSFFNQNLQSHNLRIQTPRFYHQLLSTATEPNTQILTTSFSPQPAFQKSFSGKKTRTKQAYYRKTGCQAHTMRACARATYNDGRRSPLSQPACMCGRRAKARRVPWATASRPASRPSPRACACAAAASERARGDPYARPGPAAVPSGRARACQLAMPPDGRALTGSARGHRPRRR
jgi:hypothetical protein